MWPFKKKRPPDPEDKSQRQMERADKAVHESEKALEASMDSREDTVALIAALRAHQTADSWTEHFTKILGGK